MIPDDRERRVRERFLLTYVLDDWGHTIVQKISPQQARAMVTKSPDFKKMSYFEKGGDIDLIVKGFNYGKSFLNNKFAVRVSPCKWVYRSDDNYFITEEE